jgi:hypothetical protein
MEVPMKLFVPLLAAAALAGLLAGCANWSGSGGNQPQYEPMQGGPGYGPTGPISRYNAVPEGPPPIDLQANSDSWGASGEGGSIQSSGASAGASGATGTGGSGMSSATGNTGGGSSGAEESGAGGMSSEPGIGTSGAAGRDSSGSTGSAGAASSGAPLDQQSMCELQRRVTAARTPEERQALLEQAMPGMSPETQQRHLQMMSQSCQ